MRFVPLYPNLPAQPSPACSVPLLQFVVTESAALRAHCATEDIRLELHACRVAARAPPSGQAAEGAAEPWLDYEQVASGSIPLACLVQRGQGCGGGGRRKCRLLAPSGQTVAAMVSYSLRSLRPLV